MKAAAERSRMAHAAVALDPDQLAALQAHADRRRPRAALIREAVDAWLASNAVTVVEGE